MAFMSRNFAHLLRTTNLTPVAAVPRADGGDDEEMNQLRQQLESEQDLRRQAEERAADLARQLEAAKAEKDPDNDDDDDTNEEGDDDGDEREMSAQAPKAIRHARARATARCAAIFASSAAGANPALAAELAFGTSLPRSRAVAVLAKGGRTAPGLTDRMHRAAIPVVSPDALPKPAKDDQKALAADIIALRDKARPRK